MAEISQITLPSGSTYDIKDTIARSELDNKVDKVSGKQLSTNDYTTTEKNKLAGIAAGAEVNVQSDWNVTDTSSDAFIKNKPTIPTDTWKVYYGTCTTAAATKDKAVTVASDQNFSLRVGAIVGVKFSNTNTYSSATTSPITLNVNSTGAKNIWYNNTHSGAGNTGTSTNAYGYANRIIYYMYDGTYWVWISHSVDNNTTYTAASTAPKMDGTAAVGTSTKYARQDHVHPTDTSRAAANHTHSAYVNQNAFSNVKVGSTTIAADTTTDTIQLTAGSNITLTPDATNDKITIAATNTTYTPASSAPGKVASASSVGTSTNYARQDHTHGIDLATGDNNGQVKIAGTNVSVKGLGTAAYTASGAYLASDLKGATNGVAQLDANGLVPSSQLPSYVDDVLEYSKKSSFPTTGQTGKIYVDTTTNLTYRWSGNAYVQISPSLALGTTSSTAYRGDYGNTAYTHATDSSRLTTATSSGLYKVAATAQGHIASLTAVTKADITALGIPGTDTNTDTKVTQTNTTTSADYRVLFSENANDTTQDAGARKSSKLKFNPSTGNLQATQVNGYTLAAAAGKAVDTTIATSSSSTNLPTSAAVAAFVEGKGYITSADIPQGAAASSTTPKMNGTAAVGTQTAFARGDHVHPTDTSRAAANHTHSAYVNQNAFSNVKVGSTTIAADTTTDTIQLAAGSNITLTPDATNDKVTIAATDTTYTASTTSIGSASAGTAISADDITAWTTNTPTVVTKKTVVTGGTTTSITPVTSKTVVTAASGATAAYSAGVLTLTNGSFSTGASVTAGTAVQAYTSLTTGDSVSVTAGKAASLSYTSRSIPNISVAAQTVVTGITAN